MKSQLQKWRANSYQKATEIFMDGSGSTNNLLSALLVLIVPKTISMHVPVVSIEESHHGRSA